MRHLWRVQRQTFNAHRTPKQHAISRHTGDTLATRHHHHNGACNGRLKDTQ